MQRFVLRFLRIWYVPALLAVWTFEPELRRLLDWQVGYHSFPVLALLPLLTLFPGVYFLKKEWPRLGGAYRAVLSIWLGSFGYAYLVSCFSGQTISGLYDALTFLLPAGFGALLSLEAKVDFKVAYERTARVLLWFAAAASVYGIFQYVAPPAWDVLWVQNTGFGSIGQPVPFGLRIFGTLNAPGPFADFLALVMLVNVPRLRLSRIVTSILFAPCLVALVLTLVREAWIGLALGLLVYLVLAPRRHQPILSLATIAIATASLSYGLLSINGSAYAVTSIAQRFTSFSSIGDDGSVIARQQETNSAFVEGVREPLGQGLGSIGNAAKLGAQGGPVVLDNGYLSRFSEMGFVGAFGYLLAIVMALCASIWAYVRVGRRGDEATKSLAAFAVAVQVLLIWSDGASDHHSGFPALFFWYSLFIASSVLRMVPSPTAVRQSAAPLRARVPALRPQ